MAARAGTAARAIGALAGLVSLRDLAHRRRRVAIAVLGAGLVFAMTLLVAGLGASYHAEADRVIAGVGADRWVVNDGVGGPFTGLSALPPDKVAAVAGTGVARADPVVVMRQAVLAEGRAADVNLFGSPVGGLGAPAPDEGRRVRARGEAVADASLSVEVGDVIRLGAIPLTVVGVTDGMTLGAGTPVLYVPIDDLRQAVLGGAQVASIVVTRGVPDALPEGLRAMTDDEVKADMLRPLSRAIQAIEIVQVLLWSVAAALIGSVVYLSALERARDIAVFKAVGVGSPTIAGGLALQAVAMAVVAALVAVVLADRLTLLFPMRVGVQGHDLMAMPLVATGVGLVASLAGMRRAVAVPPALAFGG